jgi:hypothetical protein
MTDLPGVLASPNIMGAPAGFVLGPHFLVKPVTAFENVCMKLTVLTLVLASLGLAQFPPPLCPPYCPDKDKPASATLKAKPVPAKHPVKKK